MSGNTLHRSKLKSYSVLIMVTTVIGELADQSRFLVDQTIQYFDDTVSSVTQGR